MPEQSWRPLFRTPRSTITKVLRSPAFVHSRVRAGAIIGKPVALRELADTVDGLDYASAPLSAIADRVAAAVRFLRARADELDAAAGSQGTAAGTITSAPAPSPSADRQVGSDAHSAAGSAARERLVVAALHYLVTPVDLVPDFRAGGYLDDVVLLSWLFGAAAQELEPFVAHDD